MKIGKFLIQALLRLLSLLPLKVHYALGRVMAFLAEKVFRYRTSDVLINLARSFPEKKYDELREIKHRFYLQLGDIIAETVWFGGCRNPERLHRKHLVELDPEGLRELNRLHELAPSVVIMVSHAGNWELYGGVASYNYSDVPLPLTEQNFCIVYLKQKSKMWDEILRDNRFAPLVDRKNFEGYLESRQLVRYVFTHRGEKKFFNINTDQHPYFNAPDFMKVKFMHQECTTMRAAADLARKFSFAVCFLSYTLESRGHWKLNYIPVCDNASEMSAEEIMNRYYRLLEADIDAQPWNYLWTHRRWKFKV